MHTVLRSFEGRFGRLALREASGALPAELYAEHLVLVKQHGVDGRLTVAGEPLPFTRGDVVFVNARHSLEFDCPATGVPMRFVACHFSGEWLLATFPALFADGLCAPFPQAHESITPRIRRLADVLVAETLNERFLSPGRLEFMVQELMLSIVESYLAKRRVSSPLWRGSRYTDHRIRKALALLRARPNKERNIDALAAQVGLSRSRFYDLFQACTGLSPRAYLDLLCVETAIARLSDGRAKIGDVSDELGFSAQSNFTRFFLHQVGVPPSEYRRATARAEASGSGAGSQSPGSAPQSDPH